MIVFDSNYGNGLEIKFDDALIEKECLGEKNKKRRTISSPFFLDISVPQISCY